jgi:hypothetical protein
MTGRESLFCNPRFRTSTLLGEDEHAADANEALFNFATAS